MAPATNSAQEIDDAISSLSAARGEARACAIPSDYEVAVALGIEEQWLAIGEGDRFEHDSLVWTGQGEIGPAGLAAPALLTYSFAPDGTLWGLEEIFNQTGPNDLNRSLRTLFGADQLELGREYMRQSLAGWAKISGLSFQEVADDGSPISSSSQRIVTRGDLRFGGVSFFFAPFVGYNAFPASGGLAGVGGGDMVLNDSTWPQDRFSNPNQDYRAFRVLVGHELGHGLGMIHTTPCTGLKLMEPFLDDLQDGLGIDDIRAAGANYGDRFAPNHTFAAAHNFGVLDDPSPRSILVRHLSTNGAGATGGTGEDWFTFSLSQARPVQISVIPTGGSYMATAQLAGCEPDEAPLIEASLAGDLALELCDGDTQRVLGLSESADRGSIEALDMGMLPAGAYAIRVLDLGPNIDETVQLYDLAIRIDGALAGPDPFAGVDKRVPIRRTTYFLGHINSSATEPGAVLTNESFDWDLDGDGAYETLDDSAPTFTYNAPGQYTATLRLTDSLGSTSEHSIRVTAFTPFARVVDIAPGQGARGRRIPVVLQGEYFEGVSSAGQITIDGGGVTVVGTPSVDEFGTLLEGLEFVVDSDAELGPRSLHVTTDGVAQPSLVTFEILPPAPDAFALWSPPNGSSTDERSVSLEWEPAAGAEHYTVQVEVDDDDDGVLDRVMLTTDVLTGTTLQLNELTYKTTYAWSVAAFNGGGSVVAAPTLASFRTPVCMGDADGDLQVQFPDISRVLLMWGHVYASGRSGAGDADGNGIVDFGDVTAILGNWNAACP